MIYHTARFVSRRWMGCSAAGLAFLSGGIASASDLALPIAIQCQADSPIYRSAYEQIMGTSLDLALVSPSSRDAKACEAEILAEIDRLSRLLSTYDSQSEISNVMRGAEVQSPELQELLDLYSLWAQRTAGSIDDNLAGVKRLWREAELTGRAPSADALRLVHLLPRHYNVDALGKAYIIERAVERGRKIVPAGLLNIGGDLRAWGDVNWPVSVADPINPAENAEPLATLNLREGAVACSGGYARYFTIAGVRYSHLIDPLTLAPSIDLTRSTAVVCDDAVTANALSTALCLRDDEVIQQLARQHARAGITTSQAGTKAFGDVTLMDFQTGSTQGGQATGQPAPAGPAHAQAEHLAAWPRGYRVEINLELIAPKEPKVKRPYVVIWIENEAGKPVRNITLWGRQERYFPHLTKWWDLINKNAKGAMSMAAATRPAGKYTVYWDGKSDFGTPQPPGKYTVRIEVSREHGNYVNLSSTVDCSGMPDSQMLEASQETAESKIEFKKSTR